MSARCPHCEEVLPGKSGPRPPEVYAELRRFDGELWVNVEFVCANCDEEIVIEQAGNGHLLSDPHGRISRFKGGEYRV